MWMVRPSMVGLALLWALGCGGREELSIGEDCEVNTDCGSPLVCEIGRCRRDCVSSRDCSAGLRCLPINDDVGGACQLEEEATCALDSECAAPLVCQMGTCATECVTNEDCLSGATCADLPTGGRACEEPETELCIYNSDCPDGEVCAPDQTCRLECIQDRDCDEATRMCVDNYCVLRSMM